MNQARAWRLFGISFLILYFELVAIRWLTSYVLYLGYFTNFVLLGSLLGIGVGVLLADHKTRFIKWLPVLMFAFFSVVILTRPQVSAEYESFIFFTNAPASIQLPPYVILPLIFLGVTAIFAMMAQELGMLLKGFEPLKAYNLNILGSLAGIASFTLVSFLSLPSWVWFLLSSGLMLLFLPRNSTMIRNILLLSGLVFVVAASDFAFRAVWSPYSRLSLLEMTPDNIQRVNTRTAAAAGDQYVLTANGIWHQTFTRLENNPSFYQFPYTLQAGWGTLEDVLVIGAGGGNDISFALANGAKSVDAVEIDPKIQQLGEKYHPEKPYDDPRVTLFIDDARSFLEKSDKTYDLVIYALPDSLVLATNTSNIRLESYLFTLEAFESVQRHLKPDGLFVLYNFYRFEWLVQKIAGMLEEVFGEAPLIHRSTEPEFVYASFATFVAGPGTSQIDAGLPGFTKISTGSFKPATDDWPFLYLQKPSLPLFYSGTLVVLLAFSFLVVRAAASKEALSRHGLPFFFMGAAFTLLETKSIVQFFLLFGSTWLVNSLVFFAVLFVVLIANWLAARYRFAKIQRLYFLLFFVLALNFLLPLKIFLFENLAWRYILATVFLFSPIFFANLIFSTTFRETKRVHVAFGANLIGTMVGGAAEYLSLYFGYRDLVIAAGLFYLLAFFFFVQMQRKSRFAVDLSAVLETK